MESKKEIRSFYENVGRFYDFMIAVVSFVSQYFDGRNLEGLTETRQEIL